MEYIFLNSNIKALREAVGLNQTDFSSIIGKNKSVIGAYEAGTSYPPFDVLIKISNYFGIGLDDLSKTNLKKDITFLIDENKNVHLIHTPNHTPNSKSEELGVQKSNSILPILNNQNVDLISRPKSRPNSKSKDLGTGLNSTIPESENENVQVICTGNYTGNSKSKAIPVQKEPYFNEERHSYGNDLIEIDIVDIKAAANMQGFSLHDGYVEKKGVMPVPTYLIRKNKKHLWFPIAGDSMEPTIYIDDYVLAMQIEPDSYHQIKDHYIYILSTRNHGILVKRVLNRLDTRGQIYAKSDNRSYSSFNIDQEEIVSVWEAKARLSFKFPNEQISLFNAVKDLESRVEELENKK